MSEIVVGGLLDPKRMERLTVIAHQGSHALAPNEVVNALIKAAFSESAANRSRREKDLGDSVQA